MKIAIVGFGIEGRSSYEYFSTSSTNHQITICDQNEDIELPEGALSQLGDRYLDNLSSFDLIVRTAGIHPDLILDNNPNVKGKITSQLNEFIKAYPTKNIIGVTGTKGKGTTATLITKILEASGKTVVLGGNIGIPLLSLLKDISSDTFAVMELSSFQLLDFREKSPHVCVCLLIEEEHLNWHLDIEDYIKSKANLFEHQTSEDKAIYFSSNELSKKIASSSPGKLIPYYAPPGAYIEDDTVKINDLVICKTSDIKLIGKHNLQNICAAITASWQYIQDIEAIRNVLTSFEGLPHRIEFVREVSGIRFYNDSYSTILYATEAAIEAVEGSKILIVGGFERNLKIDYFADFVNKNTKEFRKILIIGESGGRVAKLLDNSGFTSYEKATDLKNMQEIVSKAVSLAQNGDAVVLSPGFASFDMFKNFEDRGLQFKEAVNNL